MKTILEVNSEMAQQWNQSKACYHRPNPSPTGIACDCGAELMEYWAEHWDLLQHGGWKSRFQCANGHGWVKSGFGLQPDAFLKFDFKK